MRIILYKITDPNNKINKSIGEEWVMDGSLREGNVDVLYPEIILADHNMGSPITQYNYAYIPEFERYYFVEEMSSIRTNIWRAKLNVDVLMTYKNEILSQQVIVDKQQNNFYNKYLDDGDWICTNKTFVHVKQFPNKICENPEWILITAGSTE